MFGVQVGGGSVGAPPMPRAAGLRGPRRRSCRRGRRAPAPPACRRRRPGGTTRRAARAPPTPRAPAVPPCPPRPSSLRARGARRPRVPAAPVVRPRVPALPAVPVVPAVPVATLPAAPPRPRAGDAGVSGGPRGAPCHSAGAGAAGARPARAGATLVGRPRRRTRTRQAAVRISGEPETRGLAGLHLNLLSARPRFGEANVLPTRRARGPRAGAPIDTTRKTGHRPDRQVQPRVQRERGHQVAGRDGRSSAWRRQSTA